MAKTEIGNVEIRLNTEQALAKLKETEKEIQKLEKAIDNMGTGDAQKRHQMYEQLQQAKEEALKLRDSIKTEMRVIINGEVAGKNLRELQAALSIAKREYKSFADQGNSEGTKKLAQGIATIENEIKKLEQPLKDARKAIIDLGADNSLASLQNKARNLRAEIDKLSPGTEMFVSKTRELRAVERDVDKLNRTIGGQTGLWSGLTAQVKQFGVLAAGYLGLQALSSSVSNIISKNSQLADSVTAVMQTTGMTKQEVDELNKSFKNLDTRTSTADLREIAKVGGQFGVAKDEILGFTEAMNKSTVVLKSEFKGGAEEITTVLSGLRNVLSDTKTNDIAQDLTHLGNALVVLAQQGNATAPVVSEFANRIGGIGVPLGLSSGQILGLSATMQELSINAERGGTAVGKILQKMTTNTAEFAKIAGVPLEEFKNMVNTDIMGAFEKFLEGTKQFKGDALAMGGALKDLETSGGGVSEVLAKLGSNTSLLTEKVDTASKAIRENTAINNQYDLSNENLAGQIERLQKKLYAFVTNQTFREWVLNATLALNGFIDFLQELPAFLKRNAELLIAIAGATALYYANVIKATAATSAKTTATLLSNVADEIALVKTRLLEASTKAYAFAKGVLTGQINLATAAQRIFNAVMSLNPVGLIITALTAAGAALAYYSKNTKEAIELEKAKYNISKELAFAVNDLSKANDEYGKTISTLNRLSPEQQQNLREEIRLKREVALATLEKLKAEQSSIGAKAQKPTVIQTVTNLVTSAITGNNPADFAAKQATDATNNAKEAMQEYDDKMQEVDSQIKKLSSSMAQLDDVLNAESTAMKINVQTSAQYDEKLSLLNKALKNAVKDGEDYKRILAEINATKAAFKANDLNDKSLKLDVDTKSAEQKAQDFQQKLQKIIDEIGKAQTDAITEEAARQSEQLAANYIKAREAAKTNADALIAEQKSLFDKKIISQAEFSAREQAVQTQTNTLLLAIDEKYELERKQLAEKYRDKLREEEYQHDINNLAQWRATEMLAISRDYADQLITKEQFEQRKAEIEKQVLLLRLQYAKDYGKEITKEEQAIVDKKIELAEKEAQRMKALGLDKAEIMKRNEQEQLSKNITLRLQKLDEQEQQELALFKGSEEEKLRIADYYAQMRMSIIQEEAKKYISAMELLNSTFQSIATSAAQKRNNLENAELQRDKNNLDKKKEMLKRQLDQKLISQQQYNEKVAALDETYNKKSAAIKLAQWKRNKDAAVKTATIEALMAITRAFADYSWPYNLIVAALVGAAAYAKVDAIKSESPPQFKKGKPAGDYIQPGVGGIAQGPSHTDGGIDMIDTRTGKTVGNMEGNEMIVGVNAVENNPELAALLLQSSRNDGQRVPAQALQEIVFLDTPQTIREQADKVLKFETGKDPFDSAFADKLLSSVNSQSNASATLLPLLKSTAGYIDSFITSYTGAAVRFAAQTFSAAIPQVSAFSVPQIDTSRIIDNIRISRWGYHEAQRYSEQLGDKIPRTPADDKNETDLNDVLTEMKNMLQHTNDTLQQATDAFKKPAHVNSQIVLKDYDEVRRREEQAKRNARIG